MLGIGTAADTCAALFNKYSDPTVLTVSRQCAEWTVASIFPEASTNNADQTRKALRRDFQSHGAMLVNNLSSKIAQALFPQNSSFFEIGQTQAMLDMAQELGQDSKASASFFAGVETRASARIFLNAGYAALERAIKLLVVTGNALLYRDPTTKKFHSYSVRDYAVRRDGSGNVLLIVLKERISVADLPTGFAVEQSLEGRPLYEDVDLYTSITKQIRVTNGVSRVVYSVQQECMDKPLGEPSVYPEYLCPYIPLTWNLITGEHYGRGYVEDYAGSFAKLSALSESSLLYEVEMMRLINIVDASSGIDIDEFANAETGEYVQGRVNTQGNGIMAHEGGDAQKLSAVLNDIQSILQQLSIAFMYTGNTRDAERVTAEEIRANISEANQTLGGIYANISEVLHIHLAHILTVEEEPDMLPLLNAKGITLDVSVGIASLSREAQVQKLQYLANAVQLVLPVLQQASPRFNADLIIDAMCQGYGIDREALSYSEEQLQQLQQQQDEAAQQSQQQAAQGAAAATGQSVNPQAAQLNSQQLGLTQ